MRWLLRATLAVFFTYVGVLHFRRPRPFLDIMPPSFPNPLLLVYVSGFFEICGGIALLIPRLHAVARWGLIALLVAVFPANVYMALYNVPIAGRHFSTWLLWLRLPLQFVLMWLVWLVT